MNSPNELKEITRFLLEYANRLMGSGVHTSRVIRNTRRIGKSLDVDVKMSLFQKTIQFLSNHSLQSVSYAVRFRIGYKYIVFFNIPRQKLPKLHLIVWFSCFALLTKKNI